MPGMDTDIVELKQARVAKYWSFYQEALKTAEGIVSSRASSRDAEITPWDKMVYGEKSFVTFIFHKTCRLVSMITRREQTGLDSDKIDDELQDIINYSAMMIAFRKLRRSEQSEQEVAHDAT